jgi:hypothetical protein
VIIAEDGEKQKSPAAHLPALFLFQIQSTRPEENPLIYFIRLLLIRLLHNHGLSFYSTGKSK